MLVFRSKLLWRPMAGVLAGAVLTVSSTMASPSPGDLIQVSGDSPFTGCEADMPGSQGGVFFDSSEVEPHVVVNPVDRRNMVSAWQQDRWSNGGARGLAVGVSFNEGQSWQIVPLPGLTPCSGGEFLRASDPWLSFAPNGDLFHMALAIDGTVGRSAMLVQKSEDGGLTWSSPISLVDDLVPLFNDKNTLTVDPTDGQFIYATWDRLDFANGGGPALLARSVDGGETFESPSVIYDPGPNGQTIGNQIVVLPDGTVIDFFVDVAFLANPPFFDLAVALKYSPDQGTTWLPEGAPIAVGNIQSTFAVAEPDTNTIVRDASIIFDVAVDPKNGYLYAVWQDARFSGNQHDSIALSQSKDGGLTWSAPVQINQTPSDVGILEQQAFIPTVHANRKGEVAITYYDFRFNGEEPQALTDHWAITCRPKGKSPKDCSRNEDWSGEIRLTDNSFDMLQAPLLTGGLFVGDYVGLAGDRKDFIAIFSMPHGDDPASVFSRQFKRGPKRTINQAKNRGIEPSGRLSAKQMSERKQDAIRRVMERLHRPEPYNLF